MLSGAPLMVMVVLAQAGGGVPTPAESAHVLYDRGLAECKTVPPRTTTLQQGIKDLGAASRQPDAASRFPALTSDLAACKEALRQLNREIGDQAFEQLRAKERERFEEARDLEVVGTPEKVVAAIAVFQRVIGDDPLDNSGYNSKAQTELTACKEKLHSLARPLVDEGESACTKKDWLAARRAYRKAMATDPYDPTIQPRLDAVQTELREQASQRLKDGEHALDNGDYSEAVRALQNRDPRPKGDFGPPDEGKAPRPTPSPPRN